MDASETEFSFTRGAPPIRRRVPYRISAISAVLVLLVLGVALGAAQAQASTHEAYRPAAPDTNTIDYVLGTLTESALDQDGLHRSNLAIDQIVQKSKRLISRANHQRARTQAKDTNAPLGLVLGKASDTLSDANSFLLGLKELQDAVAAHQAHDAHLKVDVHETCKDLNVKFKAMAADLKALKSTVTALPLRQRAIVDVIIWDVEPKLNSAIQRIRQRTLQVAKALTLDSELDLNGA